MNFSALRGIALALAVWAIPVRADGIYKYVEKDGTIVYTNIPPGSKIKARKLGGTFHAAPTPREPAAPRSASAAEFDAHIERAALRYRIPPSLLWAVMHAESNFDARAVSSKGA